MIFNVLNAVYTNSAREMGAYRNQRHLSDPLNTVFTYSAREMEAYSKQRHPSDLQCINPLYSNGLFLLV